MKDKDIKINVFYDENTDNTVLLSLTKDFTEFMNYYFNEILKMEKNY